METIYVTLGLLCCNADFVYFSYPPEAFFKVLYFFVLDGQRILSCGADHFMRVLDVHTGTEVYCKDVGEEIR